MRNHDIGVDIDIYERIKALEIIIAGNGGPGLCGEVIKLKEKVGIYDDLIIIVKTYFKSFKIYLGILGVIVGAIGIVSIPKFLEFIKEIF